MKLCLIATLTIISQLVISNTSMLSLFILGIDVGDVYTKTTVDPETKEQTQRTEFLDGSVRFRAIVFRSWNNHYGYVPILNELDWKIYSKRDFTLSFTQLGKDFKKKLFDDLSFEVELSLYQTSGNYHYFKRVHDSSFTLKVNGAIFKTKDTHLGSIVTTRDITSIYDFGVEFDTKLKLKEYLPKENHSYTLLKFQFEEKYFKFNTCTEPKEKMKFEIKSIGLNESNEGASEKWNDGRYKIQSTLTQGDIVEYYPPFKIKANKRIANVIFVINQIPVKRLDATYSLTSWPSYELPFKLRSVYFKQGITSYPDPFDGYLFDVNELYKDKSVLEKDLVSKWRESKEPISMTLFFECSNNLI